jgi:hypothetical protein
MTTPRFWTDPLSGASYSFGDKLPASSVNAILDGLRAIDYAIERNQCTSFRPATISSKNVAAVCIDERYDQILALESDVAVAAFTVFVHTPNGEQQADRDVTSLPTGGWNTQTGAITSNGAGTILVGGETAQDHQEKVAVSTDGEDFVTQTMNTGGAGVGVTALAYDSGGGLFIAGLDGGTTSTTIETSPDGVTWTTRTTPNTNAIGAIATDGAGTVVAISSASTNQAIRSTDGGVSWSSVTLPATSAWTGITYSKGLGKWFVTDDGANFAVSSIGATWAVGAFNSPLRGAYRPDRLACTGNIVMAQDSYGRIYLSDDGENYVNVVEPSVGLASFSALYASSAGVVGCISNSGDSYLQIGQIFHL